MGFVLKRLGAWEKSFEFKSEMNILAAPRMASRFLPPRPNFTQEDKLMARIKRRSAVIETARERLAGLKSITPKPNFGPALDIDQYDQEVESLSSNLDKYNDTLSLLDRLQNEFEEKEAALKEKNRRMLAATEGHYGADSSEYEAVGGTRTSDRKRPTRKKKGES
jgi:hypothetical protein